MADSIYIVILLSLAGPVEAAVVVLDCFYAAALEWVSRFFGLKPLASEADTRAWLRSRRIRGIASGLVLLAMMLASDGRSVGIALLILVAISFVETASVLGPIGRKSTGFFAHGVTCAVLLGPDFIPPRHSRWLPATMLIDRCWAVDDFPPQW